jgi:hypothetical protein
MDSVADIIRERGNRLLLKAEAAREQGEIEHALKLANLASAHPERSRGGRGNSSSYDPKEWLAASGGAPMDSCASGANSRATRHS